LNLKSHLYCLVAIVIWSTLEITGKLVGERIDPFTLTAWRFIIGGLALLPFAIKQAKIGSVKLNIRSILMLGSLGILNVCISMLLLQLAIFYGKASVTAVIVSMNPLFVGLFATLILRERMQRSTIIGLLSGVFGLSFMVIFEPQMRASGFIDLPLSLLLAASSSVTFGLYTVLTKKTIQKYGNILTNSGAFIIGGISLLVVNIFIGKPFWFIMTPRSLGFVLYLGLILTGLSYLLYFEGMKILGAGKAAIYFFLKPVLASLLAVIVLGESLSLLQVVGIVFIVLALSRETLMKFLPLNRITE